MAIKLTQPVEKMLVTVTSLMEADKIESSGVRILAKYPDSQLVSGTAAQKKTLESIGFEVSTLKSEPLKFNGRSFEFSSAIMAERTAPLPKPSPDRTGYYLVHCAGPIASEWMTRIMALSGVVHTELPGYSLLIGMRPPQLESLQAEPWVEGVTPFRPAMKVARMLQPGRGMSMSSDDLAAPLTNPTSAQQVEISVFAGESTAELAASIRKAGGTVLKETPESVAALVPGPAIPGLAAIPGVQTILPHSFSSFRNDRSRMIMGVPPGNMFGKSLLDGATQMVGVADSGLDTGNLATMHQDLRGRITVLTSFATSAGLAGLVNDPPAHDDGPADIHSGHGTHVAGSVLGNGFAGVAIPASVEPLGTAPAARLYFQAVEQVLDWKTKSQLIAEGHASSSIPDWWPPPRDGLYGLPDDLNELFQPAYLAGVRIHTNSWGSSDPEEGGAYTQSARQVDEFHWTHRDMLILVAGGNDGEDNNGDGVIDAGSIGPPATARNCLSVGATENDRPSGSDPMPGLDAKWVELTKPGPFGPVPRWPAAGPAVHVSDNPAGMALFTSRGPTDDGRIKPDVVAPGTNILSTRSTVYAGADAILWGDLPTAHPLHGQYCWSGGTSMSTPLVAGIVAVIRQQLVNAFGEVVGVRPSGALLKAMVVNGARAIAGNFVGELPAGRNSASGFGRVDLPDALAPAIGVQLFSDDPVRAVSTGQMRTYTLAGVTAGALLKVTLVWTDAPGIVGDGSLTNRLYLQVVRPDGSVVDGDVSPFPMAVNNVQQVELPAPVAGSYTLRVRGVSVTSHAPSVALPAIPARQDFALVASQGTSLTAL